MCTVLITVLCHAAGIIFATFVGVVATTLSLASIGLVAVASGAGTTAAAGSLLFPPLESVPSPFLPTVRP